MGLYDALKDVLKVAQKADNLDLYKQLLDLSAQALDLQDENTKLKEENEELKRVKETESDIEYYVDSFVTRKSDSKPIKYCAACWVDKRKLVPIQDQKNDNYICPLCNTRIVDMSDWSERKNKKMGSGFVC